MGSDIAAPPSSILPPAVILAGGDGRRLGGALKALLTVGGARLIDRALDRLSAQAAAAAVCVRSRVAWADDLDRSVLLDLFADVGPLAGVAAALAWARDMGQARVLTAPVDAPFLPADLAARLAAAMAPGVEIAVAASGGRHHHLAALWSTDLAPILSAALSQGPLSARAFQARRRTVLVEWPAAAVDPFFNINTPEDLARAEAEMSRP